MFRSSNLRTTLNFTYLNWSELRRETSARARDIEQARWALGDLLAQAFEAFDMTPELEAALAAEGASWECLASSIGTASNDLRRYARVSTAFPRRKRVSGVGWDYHAAVLRLLPQASVSARQKWLREAARHEWSVRQMVARIREGNLGGTWVAGATQGKTTSCSNKAHPKSPVRKNRNTGKRGIQATAKRQGTPE